MKMSRLEELEEIIFSKREEINILEDEYDEIQRQNDIEKYKKFIGKCFLIRPKNSNWLKYIYVIDYRDTNEIGEALIFNEIEFEIIHNKLIFQSYTNYNYRSDYFDDEGIKRVGFIREDITREEYNTALIDSIEFIKKNNE